MTDRSKQIVEETLRRVIADDYDYKNLKAPVIINLQRIDQRILAEAYVMIQPLLEAYKAFHQFHCPTGGVGCDVCQLEGKCNDP